MSGGPTSARSEPQEAPQVDVEDRPARSGARSQEQTGEASWSPAPVLQRRKRRDRLGTIVALTLVAIAVAAIKPWGVGFPVSSPEAVAAPTGVLGAAATPGAQPTPGPIIADRNAMTCLTHQLEQVLTLERWPDREIKSWSQPEAGVVIIASSHVVGIGVCPGIGPVGPGGAGGTSGGETTGPAASRNPETWGGAELTRVRLLGGAGAQDLGVPTRITSQTDYVAAGVLFGPPPPLSGARQSLDARPSGPVSSQVAGGPPPAWPAGRYEISYVFPGDPESTVRTVIVEIRAPLHDG